MTVFITLDNGESYMLDRSLILTRVAEEVNAARGEGALIPFQDNHLPSRTVFIDPDHVVAITDDGYPY